MDPAAALAKESESRSNSAVTKVATPAPETLPRPFERWTLLKQIARGGMGELFLASTQGIEGAERPCVVKIIRREHASDRSFLARFLDEARIQAQLQHPGVAQILEAACDESGKPYVVVEYVEGRNLAEVRARAAQLKIRIEWPDAVALAVALAEALAHVHERTDASGQPLAIVHRDLSPQNVMVSYTGELKLIDFGTARGENRRCHTVAGIVFAKPGYVAPEVANNTPGGIPADLYAFGIMFWELVAGRRFLSGEAREHMAKVGAGERNPPPLAAELGVPAEVDRVIARLTAARIEERYSSARQATFELLEILKNAPSLADGERGVRTRLGRLMQRLYPVEPARTRAEFAELVQRVRRMPPKLPAKTGQTPVSEPAERDESLLAGTRYRLLREVGRGGMGVVYEAVHIDLGRSVALKVLPREHAASSEFGARFRAEARAIAGLHHENLVRLYEFGISADGRPFYAMEHLRGESIDVYLERAKRLEWREAFGLGIQACRAVEAAHAAGVIHRDIKPANLFLTEAGTLKLLDFGVAKLAHGMEAPDTDEPSSGVALAGTPEYMAPEQISGERVDERSDVYALGVVIYELITGHLPHDADSIALLLAAKLQIDPQRPGLRAEPRGLTHMAEETLLRSLERDPEQRFHSAAEMREALEAALKEPEIRRRRARRFGFAALSLLAIAIGSGAALAASRPDVRDRASAVLVDWSERLQHLRGGSAASPAVAAVKPAEVPAAVGKAGAPSAGDDEASADPGAAESAEADPSGKEEAELAASESPESEADKPSSILTATAKSKSAEEASSNDEADEPEAKQAEAKPADAKASAKAAADKTLQAKSADRIQDAISAAEKLITSGKRIKGLGLLRHIGRSNPKDARALKAWSEAAARVKAWGEAARVATAWVEMDKSAEARLHLARMQRAIGHRDNAVRILSRLVKDDPQCEEARNLLKSYKTDARLAMRH